VRSVQRAQAALYGREAVACLENGFGPGIEMPQRAFGRHYPDGVAQRIERAWVLLPDHMHALWTLPPGDEDFSHRSRVIERMSAQRCQTRLDRPEWTNARRRKRNQST
jgi:hypothetical protein